MTESRIANMTALFVANMMMWSTARERGEPHLGERERQREMQSRVLTSVSWHIRAARALPLLSARSNSIIHKKTLRFLREIKVASTCLYSINEMIDMLLHGQDKNITFCIS